MTHGVAIVTASRTQHRARGRDWRGRTGGRIGAGRYHAIRTLSHYTDNMDNVRNRDSAVRCSVFRELREKAAGAWEADALPTELFPLNDLRGPDLDWGPKWGQRSTPIITRSLELPLPRWCPQRLPFGKTGIVTSTRVASHVTWQSDAKLLAGSSLPFLRDARTGPLEVRVDGEIGRQIAMRSTSVTFQGHDPSVFTIMIPGSRGQS